MQQNEEIYLIGKKLTYVKNLYKLLCESSKFCIKMMAINSDEMFSYPITDMFCKAWKILFADKQNIFAVFLLNHTM